MGRGSMFARGKGCRAKVGGSNAIGNGRAVDGRLGVCRAVRSVGCLRRAVGGAGMAGRDWSARKNRINLCADRAVLQFPPVRQPGRQTRTCITTTESPRHPPSKTPESKPLSGLKHDRGRSTLISSLSLLACGTIYNSDKMSYVPRRALSTLIPPKVRCLDPLNEDASELLT